MVTARKILGEDVAARVKPMWGVDEEGEADCVLLAAEEALCAVDGVEGPHSWRGGWLVACVVGWACPVLDICACAVPNGPFASRRTLRHCDEV